MWWWLECCNVVQVHALSYGIHLFLGTKKALRSNNSISNLLSNRYLTTWSFGLKGFLLLMQYSKVDCLLFSCLPQWLHRHPLFSIFFLSINVWKFKKFDGIFQLKMIQQYFHPIRTWIFSSSRRLVFADITVCLSFICCIYYKNSSKFYFSFDSETYRLNLLNLKRRECTKVY